MSFEVFFFYNFFIFPRHGVFNGLIKKTRAPAVGKRNLKKRNLRKRGHHIIVFIAVEFYFLFFRYCVAKEKRATYNWCRALGRSKNSYGGNRRRRFCKSYSCEQKHVLLFRKSTLTGFNCDMLLNKMCFDSEILHAYVVLEHANAVLSWVCY